MSAAEPELWPESVSKLYTMEYNVYIVSEYNVSDKYSLLEIGSSKAFKTSWQWDIRPKPVWGGSYNWVSEKWQRVQSGTEPSVISLRLEQRWMKASHPNSSHPFCLMFSLRQSWVLPTKPQTNSVLQSFCLSNQYMRSSEFSNVFTGSGILLLEYIETYIYISFPPFLFVWTRTCFGLLVCTYWAKTPIILFGNLMSFFPEK